MSLAQFRKVFGRQGAGRFVVSEGIAPSTYLLPHEALPTLYTDLEDDRFEIVITKGTILSVVTDSNGDSRIVPAHGSGSNKSHNDAVAAILHDTIEDTETTPAELEDRFGRDVRGMVEEMADDKRLSKDERKRHQIEHDGHAWRRIGRRQTARQVRDPVAFEIDVQW